MERRRFLKGLAAAALGTAALVPLMDSPGLRRTRRYAERPAAERRRARFANVVLRTQEGRDVRFYDDLIKDRTVLLNFFYTNCVGEAICPMATANLVKVQKLLGPRAGKEVLMCSITLDPEHDTPGVLKRYARAFGARPGWLFLTGAKEDIETLRRDLGYVNPDPVKDRDPSQHIGMLRFGVEPLERWAACPCLSNPRWIVRYLAWMDPGGERAGLQAAGRPRVARG